MSARFKVISICEDMSNMCMKKTITSSKSKNDAWLSIKVP